MLALLCILISLFPSFLVIPYNPLAGNEAGGEGFADLFPEVRSSAGVAGVSVIFLILASLSALLGLFIRAVIYHIQQDRGAADEHRLLYDARDLYTSAAALLTWGYRSSDSSQGGDEISRW